MEREILDRMEAQRQEDIRKDLHCLAAVAGIIALIALLCHICHHDHDDRCHHHCFF